jgi:hypothetical protein
MFGMKRMFVMGIGLAALAAGAAGTVLKKVRDYRDMAPGIKPSFQTRIRNKGGRHFNSANISRSHTSSLRKLRRAARRGEITLPMTGKVWHEWMDRPLAARS